jgi:hypothetical protein
MKLSTIFRAPFKSDVMIAQVPYFVRMHCERKFLRKDPEERSSQKIVRRNIDPHYKHFSGQFFSFSK